MFLRMISRCSRSAAFTAASCINLSAGFSGVGWSCPSTLFGVGAADSDDASGRVVTGEFMPKSIRLTRQNACKMDGLCLKAALAHHALKMHETTPVERRYILGAARGSA